MSRFYIVLLITGCLIYTGCDEPPPPQLLAETDAACCPTPESVMAQHIQDDSVAEAVLDSTGATVALINEGHALYTRHGCGVCHGVDGRGDGPVAATLKPQPRDFRDPAAYKNGRTIRSIAKTINWGMAGASSVMPAFPHIPGDERVKIAYYINALQKDEK